MASESSLVATEAPLSSLPAPAPPAAHSPGGVGARSTKRPREVDPTSPRSLTTQQRSPLQSPTKIARLTLGSAPHLAPLTGAAALEDERRRREQEHVASGPPPTTENPSHKALASLLSGATQAMSRATDVPPSAPTATMESAPKNATAPLSIPTSNMPLRTEDKGETSPQSTTSMTGIQVTESPTSIDPDGKSDSQVAGHDERHQPSSLSYPGTLQATGNVAEPTSRGMSYPIPSQGQTSPMSGSKKHKCPYCSTEFTRHHNLKSHLLTHSQEKPFVCTDCQMRFRRLHDLKRHGKLHTGEKPHICPKCDRKFARGDALARHSKGSGGCAGRRPSMGGSFVGDDMDGSMVDDDSAMSGLTYDNAEEDELRRQSLPSISSQHGSQSDSFAAHSRTYPPAGPRPAAGGLYPPNLNPNPPQGSATASSPSVPGSLASGPAASISSLTTTGGPAMYSQAGMTESPKPLSPGAQGQNQNQDRQRSPNPVQQLQQQQYSRRQSDLQSPHATQGLPKLPGLSHPGFAAPSNSTGFPPRRSSGAGQGNGDNGNMFAQSDPSVWAYMQALEERVKSLTDRVVSLDHEVVSLKKQLATRETAATTNSLPAPTAPAPVLATTAAAATAAANAVSTSS